MLVGYARVSTLEQDAALQRDALKRAGCERIFEETASGGKVDRPHLARALDHMRKGDTLVVWKLDRLARSIGQLIETVNRLEKGGVQLRSLTENIDTGSAGGRLTFHIFGAMAEFERALIRERTLAGLAAARARGRKPGRHKSLSADDLKLAETMLMDKTYTHADVAERLGVNRSTLFRNLKAARQAEEARAGALTDDQEFAAVVKLLAKAKSTKPLIGKRAIAEAYDAGIEKGLAFGTLDEFKERLAEAAKQGRIQLERCDVAGVVPKALLTRSRLRLGRDERHLIVREDL